MSLFRLLLGYLLHFVTNLRYHEVIHLPMHIVIIYDHQYNLHDWLLTNEKEIHDKVLTRDVASLYKIIWTTVNFNMRKRPTDQYIVELSFVSSSESNLFSPVSVTRHTTVYKVSFKVKAQKDDFLPYHSNSTILVRLHDRTEWRHLLGWFWYIKFSH